MAASRFHASDALARSWLILLLIAVLSAVGISWWHRGDTLPPLKDEAEHLRAGLRWQAILAAPIRERPRLLAARLASDPPPLLYAASVPLRACGVAPGPAGGIVNAVCIALLLASVFGIGSILHGEGTGAAAAALAVSYPLALCLPRYYLPGTAETALAAAAVYAALRAERSRRVSWHLALGLAFGLGMLAAISFPLFAAPPVACVFFAPRRTLRYRGSRARRSGLLAAAAGVAAMAAAPWYALHAGSWRLLLPRLSPGGLVRYPCALLDSAIFLPLAALFLAGLVSAILRRRADPALIAWFFIPLLALGLSGAGDPRIFAPALPAAALITAAGIAMLSRPAARAGLIAAAAIAATLNSAALTFPLTRKPIDISLPLWTRDFRVVVIRGVIPCGEMGPPRRENWRLDEIMREIAGRAGAGQVSLGWFIAPHPRFNRAGILLCIEAGGYPVVWTHPRYADFILTRILTGGQREQLRRFITPWLHLEKLNAYPLPDGSVAELNRAGLTRRRRYDARDLPAETGDAGVPDETASCGWARHADRDTSPPGALVKGPGHPLEPGAYRLTVRMRCARAKAGVPLVRIAALAGEGTVTLASRELSLPGGGDSGGYRAVDLHFDMPGREPLDVRVIHTGAADLWVDSLSLEPRMDQAADTGSVVGGRGR